MKPALTDEQRDEETKRKIVFIPCTSKATLHAWIKMFLRIDMPDTIVDPESNSSPMDFIWEIYHAGMTGKSGIRRLLAYASRDSGKTIATAILEVLSVLHMRRDVAHMAAIEQQAKKAQSYVKSFFRKPILRDFIVGSNERRKEIVRYRHEVTGENLTIKQFSELPLPEKVKYEEIANYIVIIVCTAKSTNSEHVPLFVTDELDLADPVAFEEAKMVPTATLDGREPITVLTSSRKYAFGLVQEEINKADKTGLAVRHWSIVDVTAGCAASRHRPDLPMIDVYYSRADLTTISPDTYEYLTPEQKRKYEPDRAYSGCMSNCKIFAMCRGNLATRQRPYVRQSGKNAVTTFIKSVENTQGLFSEVDVDVAKAQLMCWKPSSEGLIYPFYDPAANFITAGQMAHKLTGEEYPPNFSKAELIALMQTREVKFRSGMDFGFSHNFAVVTAAIDGNRCFVFDVISQAGIELVQQVEACDKLRVLRPRIWADDSQPSSILTFKRSGFSITKAGKAKGSVVGGIENVRALIRTGIGETQFFLLRGDPGCQVLNDAMLGYHWMLDTAGNPTDEPAKKNDDELDALRYMVMNVFGKKLARRKKDLEADSPGTPTYLPTRADNWLSKEIAQHLGGSTEPVTDLIPVVNRKNGFFWSI